MRFSFFQVGFSVIEVWHDDEKAAALDGKRMELVTVLKQNYLIVGFRHVTMPNQTDRHTLT
jgi:hypothetical protein